MTLGRNDPCHCGSGRKHKKCCGPADEARRTAEVAAATEKAKNAAPEADTAADDDAKAPGQRAPKGDWMHQPRSGKEPRRKSKVGKDSL
jgi:hypothetical protein